MSNKDKNIKNCGTTAILLSLFGFIVMFVGYRLESQIFTSIGGVSISIGIMLGMVLGIYIIAGEEN
jgi:hypothetical protein